MSSLPQDDRIKLAAITGHHSFDAPGFQQLWRSIPDVDAYPQSLDDWAADAGEDSTVLLTTGYPRSMRARCPRTFRFACRPNSGARSLLWSLWCRARTE